MAYIEYGSFYYTIIAYIIILLIVVALDFRGEGNCLRFNSYFWEIR